MLRATGRRACRDRSRPPDDRQGEERQPPGGRRGGRTAASVASVSASERPSSSAMPAPRGTEAIRSDPVASARRPGRVDGPRAGPPPIAASRSARRLRLGRRPGRPGPGRAGGRPRSGPRPRRRRPRGGSPPRGPRALPSPSSRATATSSAAFRSRKASFFASRTARRPWWTQAKPAASDAASTASSRASAAPAGPGGRLLLAEDIADPPQGVDQRPVEARGRPCSAAG